MFFISFKRQQNKTDVAELMKYNFKEAKAAPNLNFVYRFKKKRCRGGGLGGGRMRTSLSIIAHEEYNILLNAHEFSNRMPNINNRINEQSAS